jgi:cytochrome c biogenesis protein CcdA/thiol-disulfide isomerase/thioredoxin
MRRIVVVTLSLGVSVVLFTLLLKASTALIAVPQSFWQSVSGSIIVGLGLAMVFPRLWDVVPFLNTVNKESNKALAVGYSKQNIAGDVLTGAALGPVFSSCSPTYFLILATVLPRSIPEGLLHLFAFALGLCGGLFVVALAGQKLLERLGVASDPRGWIKKSMGVLFVVLGVAIFLGLDKKLEVFAAERFFDVTKVEHVLLQAREASDQQEQSFAVLPNGERESAKARTYTHTPEVVSPSGYVNTAGKPITIGEFIGKKVVLVDFWTYSCINCQRTLPYLKAWDEKYRDLGLQIIGIHTPEFAFEKVQKNVETAVQGFGLTYPSILDNAYGTWGAFNNSYWPRKYLVDIDGYIVYDHAGEGNYEETERAIQKALQERAAVLGTGELIPADIVNPRAPSVRAGSPETYFGAWRNEYLANGMPFVSGSHAFLLPNAFDTNKLYLDGTWNITHEYARSVGRASIVFRYAAQAVYFVAASEKGARVRLLIDGKPIPVSMQGADVVDGEATIQGNRLYKLVEDTAPAVHTLEIRVEEGILDAYTFTFGWYGNCSIWWWVFLVHRGGVQDACRCRECRTGLRGWPHRESHVRRSE